MAGELLALRGEIDIATADAFRSDLYACVERADLPIAFVDLEAVTFMDSAGYHALVDAMDHALERGRIIVFRNLSSKCLRVVSICDVDCELRMDA